MCGEKFPPVGASMPIRGSPPRVRGKDVVRESQRHTGGITPACAGKRFWKTRTRTGKRDHPRVCGEKAASCCLSVPSTGSPPRVRGKALVLAAEKVKFGITPACAGKSHLAQCKGQQAWDHPRVCGEKMQTTIDVWAYQGSPPRVRGKAPHGERPGAARGITPACAGKSGCHRGRRRSCWDHPRVCGEKSDDCNFRCCSRGSPPRVRGKD